MCQRATNVPSGSKEREKTWTKEDIMKTIVSALIALAVLAGVAAPAGAGLDAKKFFAQLDRSRH